MRPRSTFEIWRRCGLRAVISLSRTTPGGKRIAGGCRSKGEGLNTLRRIQQRVPAGRGCFRDTDTRFDPSRK
jgi:hypothetical protein